jgi:alpha-1,3-rhamnosyl/mannosyltransferase
MSVQKRLRVGLDARSIFMPRPRGTGRNLLDAYKLIPSLRPEWEFVLYHQRAAGGVAPGHGRSARSRSVDARASLLALPNVHARRIDMPGDRFDLWFQVRLPAAAWRDGIDLLHLPANVAPARCPVPFVVTIHDLIPLALAGELSPRGCRAFRRGVERAVRGATRIISPSNATRTELHERLGVDLDRVSVVPWAPDGAISSVSGESTPAISESTDSTLRAETERVRAQYELRRAYLLNFSGSSIRKNADGLVDAFGLLSPELRGEFQLVLVGVEPAARRGELRARSERVGVRPNCRFLGFVPQEDLPGLLCGAHGLLMPSLCEGFGLPILDAFACGVPVLTSDLSSMPEVAGDAAAYCNPHDSADIAGGIARLLEAATAERLKHAGFRRLRDFSWERTARLMCEVYEDCLARSPRGALTEFVTATAAPRLRARD